MSYFNVQDERPFTEIAESYMSLSVYWSQTFVTTEQN